MKYISFVLLLVILMGAYLCAPKDSDIELFATPCVQIPSIAVSGCGQKPVDSVQCAKDKNGLYYALTLDGNNTISCLSNKKGECHKFATETPCKLYSNKSILMNHYTFDKQNISSDNAEACEVALRHSSRFMSCLPTIKPTLASVPLHSS